jgi:two-component system cell cycle response regulator
MAGRILIVDDVATNRLLLNRLLTLAYYDVDEAEDGHQALEVARRSPPDVMLVDLMMPGMDGFDLCRSVKRDPALSDIPVVVVTGATAAESRVRALDSGADDFLTKPVREEALFARLRSLMRMKAMTDELRLREETMRGLIADSAPPLLIEPPPGARVLSVTSERNGALLRQVLERGLDVRVQLALTARDAFRMAALEAPEALIVDTVGFSEFNPNFYMAARQRPDMRSAAMLSLVQADRADLAVAALDAGANDYAQWPLDPGELRARMRTQLRYKAYADHLRASVSDGLRMAISDPLTGLKNRRYLDAHLSRMMQRAIADKAPLCLLAFDLDRFKAVNDTWGHAAGDAILKQFAERLTANTRSVDLVARTGGEEFLVVMPDAPLADARIAAERVREAVERPGFDIGGRVIDMTVSVGVSALRQRGDSVDRLMARADAALYASKASGRNRVTLAAA